MWIVLAIVSSISLGFYDIVKKLALEGNNVFHVLFLNTFFCTLFMSPVLIYTLGDMDGNFVHPMSHFYLFVKAMIVAVGLFLHQKLATHHSSLHQCRSPHSGACGCAHHLRRVPQSAPVDWYSVGFRVAGVGRLHWA